MDIQSGINIANIQPIKPKNGLQKFDFNLPDHFSAEAQEERAQRLEKAYQENLTNPQNTVVRKNGEILLSVGDNGFKYLSRNSDVHLFPVGASAETMLQALKNKYGSSLSIERYAQGQGPSYADILEEQYGFKPQKPVDILA